MEFGFRARGYKVDFDSPQNSDGTYTFASLNACGLNGCEGLIERPWHGYRSGPSGGGPLRFTMHSGDPALGIDQIDVGAFVQRNDCAGG